jgi:hypothetical protein
MRATIRLVGVMVLLLGTASAAAMNNMRLLIICAGVGLALYLVGRSE